MIQSTVIRTFAAASLLALATLVHAAPGAQAPAPAPRTLQDCADCPRLVVVPPGRFRMGSEDGEKGRPEGPVHEVRIRRPFAIGQYEVTLAQFRRFVEATGHEVPAGCRVPKLPLPPPGRRVEWVDDAGKSWSDPGLIGGAPSPDMPVVCIGQGDAQAYVDWLRLTTGKPYRLPSEAEWEYAARAGGSGIYPWNNNVDSGCAYANLYDKAGRRAADFGWGFADCDDGVAELAPVGRYQPNAFGLYDVIGNAWEWLADCHRETYDTTPTDGTAVPDGPDCKLYAVRGGGWMTRPSRQRLTFRGRDPRDTHYNYFGFRVARDLAPDESRR